MNTQQTAVVFPGQGTQRHGMGVDFFERFTEARTVYDEASGVLGWDVAAMCFGDDPRLDLTEFAQPCILTTEIAMFRSLEAHYGFFPDFFGGHSLGEYTALTAAGVIPLTDAVKIVHIRGKLMQEACSEKRYGMAAVISDEMNLDDITGVISELPVDIANINSKNQVVLSGELNGLGQVETRLAQGKEDADALRFVPLNVSAAFHSRFMKTIKDAFKNFLRSHSKNFNTDRSGNVTSNFSGGFHENSYEPVQAALVNQSFSPVKWRENMESLAEKAADIVEVGPARPLRSFFSSQGIVCRSVTSIESAARCFKRKEDGCDISLQ